MDTERNEEQASVPVEVVRCAFVGLFPSLNCGGGTASFILIRPAFVIRSFPARPPCRYKRQVSLRSIVKLSADRARPGQSLILKQTYDQED